MGQEIEQIKRAASLFSVAYAETEGFGVAHEIVATGSVSTSILLACLARDGLTASETALIHCLRGMSGRDRLVAYHLSVLGEDKDENLPYATEMAADDMDRFGDFETDQDGAQLEGPA